MKYDSSYVKFSVVESANYEYVRACAEWISHLSESACKKLGEASIKYCEIFSDYVGISIFKPVKDNVPACQANMNDKWEIEYGLLWIHKGDDVIHGHRNNLLLMKKNECAWVS